MWAWCGLVRRRDRDRDPAGGQSHLRPEASSAQKAAGVLRRRVAPPSWRIGLCQANEPSRFDKSARLSYRHPNHSKEERSLDSRPASEYLPAAEHPLAGSAGGVQRHRLALRRQPHHPAERHTDLEQRLQQRGGAVRRRLRRVFFRCDDRARRMDIHAGFSADGVHWRINPNTIDFVCADPEIGKLEYRYDPRVCWIEDRYYVSWCNGYHGPTIGLAYTHDFITFHQLENAFCPTTATVSCSRGGSTGATRCSAGPATADIRRSATCTTARARICASGGGIGS